MLGVGVALQMFKGGGVCPLAPFRCLVIETNLGVFSWGLVTGF